MTSRQSEQFRNYLSLLFSVPKGTVGKKAAQQAAKPQSGSKAYT
jgi:hypothetical protein